MELMKRKTIKKRRKKIRNKNDIIQLLPSKFMNKKIFLILGLALLLSSCSPKIDFENFQKNNDLENIVENEVLLEDVLRGEKILALASENNLFVVDPEFAKPVNIYKFKDKEIPTAKKFGNFKVSPNKKNIVWYSPKSGLISLDIKSKETKIIEPASDFFNTYPYFEFYNQKDILNFIVNEGNTLRQVNLDTNAVNDVNIPYPYGNVFKISPDENLILFVSGFGQSKVNPKFMFTDLITNVSKQFETETNLFERNNVFWAPDSSGILLINGKELDFYPVSDPEKPNNLITLKDDEEIEFVEKVGENIFVFDNKGYWHVYNFYARKEIARAPIVIAKELVNPLFIPWSKNQFLIEETIKNQDNEFNRLWISDFRGNKKIVIDKYNEITLNTQEQILN